MLEALRLGGWGMYPTLLFGTLLLVTTVRWGSRPERPRALVALLAAALTLLSGTLGFVTGLISTTLGAASGRFPEPLPVVVLTGVGESLFNVSLALVLLVLAALVATVSALRHARGPA